MLDAAKEGRYAYPAINISSLIKADNGLTVNSGTVELGGTLTKPTTITASAANPLALQGLAPEHCAEKRVPLQM